MLIARFRREMIITEFNKTEATDQVGFSKADHSNVHCMDQQGADGMKPSLSFVVTGSQLSYEEGKKKKKEKGRMRKRTESEINEKTYGQPHYKEFL